MFFLVGILAISAGFGDSDQHPDEGDLGHLPILATGLSTKAGSHMPIGGILDQSCRVLLDVEVAFHEGGLQWHGLLGFQRLRLFFSLFH